MILDVYDVEHGACALITTSNGRRVMMDSGHNATTGWRPGTYLRSLGITAIDQLCITNYDEDHVSGLLDLLSNVAVGVLARNPSVLPADIRQLKTENGMGCGIETLVNSAERLFTGPPPEHDFGDTEFSFFGTATGCRRSASATRTTSVLSFSSGAVCTKSFSRATWKSQVGASSF